MISRYFEMSNILDQFYYCYYFYCVFGCTHTHAYMHAGAYGGQRYQIPGAGVVVICKLPDIFARNLTWVLHEWNTCS